MALNLVIGYAAKGGNDTAEILYFGEDGDAALAVMNQPNEKFPRRELTLRPAVVKRRYDTGAEVIPPAVDEATADEAAPAKKGKKE